MIDLTIVIPTIRTGRIPELLQTIEAAACGLNYEVIFVGPNIKDIKTSDNITLIQDFGCPSRCVQIAALVARGEYITWGSDDGNYNPYCLSECVEILRETNAQDGHNKNEMIVRWVEGYNRNINMANYPTGNGLQLGYYHAHFHDSLRFKAFPEDLMVAAVGMLRTDYFISLGGFDCSMWHINMSCIDLSIRLQNDGGRLHLSPSVCQVCDFEDHNPVHSIYHTNDYPVFKKLWDNEEGRSTHINYNNWMYSEPVWSLRWKVDKK